MWKGVEVHPKTVKLCRPSAGLYQHCALTRPLVHIWTLVDSFRMPSPQTTFMRAKDGQVIYYSLVPPAFLAVMQRA
ncbi:hypothetical protein BaRGS_00033481 [Batillaria attramentaria]|uniref:Uncharacterized protein n=1 Tax=Batillaria attramentaria TaxID=370345 RepID=A0ABD0JJX3_9CAEN